MALNIIECSKIMKRFLQSCALLSLAGFLTTNVQGANAPGYVDFGKFSAAAASDQFVEVNIKSNLISMVARLTEKSEPEVTKLLSGLQAVRVNVIKLNDENRSEVETRVKKIRGDLDDQSWERIVTAQQKGQDVSIYLKTKGSEAIEGLVVLVLAGKGEAVLVNIVGNIKPEQVATVGERLNIEPLKKIGRPLKTASSKE